ncbi:MAG TPA: hypothetical protein VFA94_04780 [Acidimicrobiales bacterium]|nr:hypothetical protein [Acidimicrobiales bacterium]
MRLFAAIVVLMVFGVVGVAVHSPSGQKQRTAASSTTTAAPSSSSSAAPTSTAPTTAITATTLPTTTTSAPSSGSGLGTSGSGQVASGQSPTPQTGGAGWLIVPGLACLGLAWGARRLARAAT